MVIDVDKLKPKVENLNALLQDPEPGVSSWRDSVKDSLERLRAELKEEKADRKIPILMEGTKQISQGKWVEHSKMLEVPPSMPIGEICKKKVENGHWDSITVLDREELSDG